MSGALKASGLWIDKRNNMFCGLGLSLWGNIFTPIIPWYCSTDLGNFHFIASPKNEFPAWPNKLFVHLGFKVSVVNKKAKQSILFLSTLHYSQFSYINKDLDKHSFLEE